MRRFASPSPPWHPSPRGELFNREPSPAYFSEHSGVSLFLLIHWKPLSRSVDGLTTDTTGDQPQPDRFSSGGSCRKRMRSLTFPPGFIMPSIPSCVARSIWASTLCRVKAGGVAARRRLRLTTQVRAGSSVRPGVPSDPLGTSSVAGTAMSQISFISPSSRSLSAYS